MPIGFRILPAAPPPPEGLVAALAGCPTAHLADSMSRLQAASGALVPRHRPGIGLCGPALTVRAAPGDFLMVQKALDLARPGDVLAVDGGGFLDQAIFGDVLAAYAVSRGLAGFVVDGAVRDVAAIAAGDFPVYSRGVSPRGPTRAGPGEINVPVSIGGMVVHPGDILVGDADGLVAVPVAAAGEVLRGVEAIRLKDATNLAAIARGEYVRPWMDAALRAGGCGV